MRGYFYTMKKAIWIFALSLLCMVFSDVVYRRFVLHLQGPVITSSVNASINSIITDAAKGISWNSGVPFDIYKTVPLKYGFRILNQSRYDRIAAKFNGGMTDDIGKQWNGNFFKSVFQNPTFGYYETMVSGYSDSCPTYTPYDSTIFPVYRYASNCSIPESNLCFNDFGWTGSDISFVKPEKTIRIAFLGGSTTQRSSECEFDYTDHVRGFLQEWATKEGVDVNFETINTGRVALRSMDFEAITKYELVPVEPDICVYYEGRNQFGLQELVGYNHYDPSNSPTLFRLFGNSAWLQIAAKACKMNLLKAIEDSKPQTRININAVVKTENPDPYNPNLPISLPQIVSDLDKIRTHLSAINSELVLCSFAMIVNDSLFQDGLHNASIYSYWIHDYGNVLLKDIEALNRLENDVFKRYSEKHNIPFFDVAADLKKTPEAFKDGIHLSCEGMKLHGWSVFTQLLPLIKQKLERGELPKQTEQKETTHPFLKDEWNLAKMPN